MSASDDAARLREALRAAREGARVDAHRRAAFVLREHAIARIDRALSDARERALLVKGAALARTVYPVPWARDMCDLDLLAAPGMHDRIVAALVRAGLQAPPGDRDRPLSRGSFGETTLRAPAGGAEILVEVHAHLDKLVERPVDHAGIVRRAGPLPGLSALLAPSPEDHALLVVLHLASSELRHEVGFVDLDLLLRAGLDEAAFVARAKSWRLATAAYAALSTLCHLGGAARPDLLDELRPSPARRAMLARHYEIGRFPVAKGPPRLGLPWIVRQTALRDDTAAWLAGVARYAVVRGAERLVLAPLRRVAGPRRAW